MVENQSTGDEQESDSDLKWYLALLAALRFLTLIPVSYGVDKDQRAIKKSLVWFPVIGLVIGAVACAVVYLLFSVTPHTVQCFFAILLLGGISGFLHYDGFADTADGFLSSRPKAKMLEIMRDSRVGVMGVAGLIFLISGKFLFLYELDQDLFFKALILTPVAGRCSIPFQMALIPYSRSEGGLATIFYTQPINKACFVAGILFCSCGFFLYGFVFFINVAFTFICLVLFIVLCKKKIGGLLVTP